MRPQSIMSYAIASLPTVRSQHPESHSHRRPRGQQERRDFPLTPTAQPCRAFSFLEKNRKPRLISHLLLAPVAPIPAWLIITATLFLMWRLFS